MQKESGIRVPTKYSLGERNIQYEKASTSAACESSRCRKLSQYHRYLISVIQFTQILERCHAFFVSKKCNWRIRIIIMTIWRWSESLPGEKSPLAHARFAKASWDRLWTPRQFLRSRGWLKEIATIGANAHHGFETPLSWKGCQHPLRQSKRINYLAGRQLLSCIDTCVSIMLKFHASVSSHCAQYGLVYLASYLLYRWDDTCLSVYKMRRYFELVTVVGDTRISFSALYRQCGRNIQFERS